MMSKRTVSNRTKWNQFTGTFRTIIQEINVFTVRNKMLMELIAYMITLLNSFLTSTNGEYMVTGSFRTVVNHIAGHLREVCTKQIARNASHTLEISIIFQVVRLMFQLWT